MLWMKQNNTMDERNNIMEKLNNTMDERNNVMEKLNNTMDETKYYYGRTK